MTIQIFNISDRHTKTKSLFNDDESSNDQNKA